MPSKKPEFILITGVALSLPVQAQLQIQEIQVIGREVNMVGLALQRVGSPIMSCCNDR